MSIQSEALHFSLADETATLELGGRIAAAMGKPPLVIHLAGDLGAGKTTLVRGILRSLGYQGKVVSPTYTLLEPYDAAGMHFLHVDLYRIAHAEELEFLGLRDGLENAVLLVEWPEKGAGFLPKPDLCISLAATGQGRDAVISAETHRGAELARQLKPLTQR